MATQLTLRAHLAGHARHLGGERTQLIDDAVDGSANAKKFPLKPFSFNLQRHALGEVPFCHGADHSGDFAGGLDEVTDEAVDGITDDAPGAARIRKLGAMVELAFFANDGGGAVDLLGEAILHLDDFVQSVGDLAGGAGEFDREACGEVAFLDGVERA